MGRYKIQESVGRTVQPVHTYADLEIHHPSQKGHEKGRAYATIEGEREEILKQRTSANHLMVSKDFILSDRATGSSRVPVPSPVSGYVARVDERNGLIAILDREGGELIAQVRHMDLRNSTVREGQQVQYGQPLGMQSGFGRGNPRAYGTHVHMDINEAQLDQFKKYIRDLDSGLIAINKLPPAGSVVAETNGVARDAIPHSISGDLKNGSSGPEVDALQERLIKLGYQGVDGRPLRIDGDFGDHTEEAVREFQRTHGIRVDGVVGPSTREAFAKAARVPLLSERTHADHSLFQEAMKRMPTGTFRNSSELERGAAALALAAKQAGLTHIDHVMPNTRGDGLIAVQGNLQDPGRHVVSIDKAGAIAQSIEQSTARLEQHVGDHQQSARAQVRAEHMEHRSGLVLGIRQ